MLHSNSYLYNYDTCDCNQQKSHCSSSASSTLVDFKAVTSVFQAYYGEQDDRCQWSKRAMNRSKASSFCRIVLY